jgi:hypothetical protein
MQVITLMPKNGELLTTILPKNECVAFSPVYSPNDGLLKRTRWLADREAESVYYPSLAVGPTLGYGY